MKKEKNVTNIAAVIMVIGMFGLFIYGITKIKLPKYEYRDIVTPWDECKKAGGVYLTGFFSNQCVFPPKAN